MTTTQRLKTNNPTWGFHGTLVTSMGASETLAGALFDVAARTLVGAGIKKQRAVKFLDSRCGRYLADDLAGRPDVLQQLEGLTLRHCERPSPLDTSEDTMKTAPWAIGLCHVRRNMTTREIADAFGRRRNSVREFLMDQGAKSRLVADKDGRLTRLWYASSLQAVGARVLNHIASLKNPKPLPPRTV